MKYLKIFLFFVLCSFNVSETIRYDESENVFLIVNNLITKNNNWASIIENRKILIINKFQTIKMYLTQFATKSISRTSSSSQTKLYVPKSNILQTLSFMYTALKCEYANIVRDILQHIYQYKELFCQSLTEDKCIDEIFDSLKVLQKHLDKVIFNLFNFQELSSNLKSSDQTLTVSFLIIHVFLYNNNLRNVRDKTYVLLKNVLHQMISLVNNFICKSCLFEFTKLDTPSDVKILKSDSLDKYLLLLQEFNDIGLINDEYIADLYNPNNYLMFNSSVELNDITITSKLKSVQRKTKDILQLVKNSCDIKNVLKYQIFFIELLRSIFSKKIINLLKNSSNNSNNESYSQLELIYNSFCKYMDLIPDNYPSTLLKFINDIKNALETDLESDTYNFESLNNIQNILSEKSLIYSEVENSQNDIMTFVSLTDLIINIKVSPYFTAFKQTFELFLQEPNILNEYYLLDKNENTNKLWYNEKYLNIKINAIFV
uniref:Uncharacterized protein n=1 Tax=Schizaphis graminum TaxID=13262 RepID=A0A2S2N733_SCHGA